MREVRVNYYVCFYGGFGTVLIVVIEGVWGGDVVAAILESV